MIVNFYSTVITGFDDLTEGDHMVGAFYNSKAMSLGSSKINYNISIGAMLFKQKVEFANGVDFNLEAPSPVEAVGLIRFTLPFGKKNQFDIGISVGTGIGGILTSPRIPDYFKGNPQPSPGRKKPSETYFDGYKFHGIAGSIITRFDFTYNNFNLFVSPTLTGYKYDKIKLPIGDRVVNSYGIFGVVLGVSTTFNLKKR